jgi:hypothetical protein
VSTTSGPPRTEHAETVDHHEPPASAAIRAVSIAGWLFDAREFAPESCPADLDSLVSGLATAAGACAALGFAYLPVLIPAKRNLINVTPSSDRGWVAELNARLRDVDDVELMTLFGVLRHAHRHGPPYHRTDADWNDLGAFFVTRSLLKEAHKRVPALCPPALADLHLRPVRGYRGTLAGAPKSELIDGEPIACEADIAAEDGIAIDSSQLRALRMPVESHLAQAGPTRTRVYACPAHEQDGRVAVLGDLGALSVVLWLAESTRRTTFFSSATLPLAQLELERPQILIHLMRETDLLSGWPPSPATAWVRSHARGE